MSRALFLAYGLVSYALFLAAFLYAVWWVWTMDASAPPGPWTRAVLEERGFWIDAGFLALFAVQHSVMARPAFKRWWTSFVPEPIERSTFVLLTSLILIGMIRFWSPLPGWVWDLRGSAAGAVLSGLFWVGWLTVLVSTFLVGHFDLFGLRQVWLHFKGITYTPPGFRTPSLYKLVRHPIMLGFLIAFWSAPLMTSGHLFFALMTSAYILVAIQIEERDLVRAHPSAYPDYRRKVSMLLPLPKRG